MIKLHKLGMVLWASSATMWSCADKNSSNTKSTDVTVLADAIQFSVRFEAPLEGDVKLKQVAFHNFPESLKGLEKHVALMSDPNDPIDPNPCPVDQNCFRPDNFDPETDPDKPGLALADAYVLKSGSPGFTFLVSKGKLPDSVVKAFEGNDPVEPTIDLLIKADEYQGTKLTAKSVAVDLALGSGSKILKAKSKVILKK